MGLFPSLKQRVRDTGCARPDRQDRGKLQRGTNQILLRHDADSSGSLISQTLTKATKARAARSVEVVDLGFFPWTALAKGCFVNRFERMSKNRRPVSDYIKERDAANDEAGNPNNEPNWESWLQDWRVELNAMTTADS